MPTMNVPQDVIDALARLPAGPWSVSTSCSFRRVTGPAGIDGDVLHALNQKSDGHPDLSMNQRELEALCSIVNGLRFHTV